MEKYAASLKARIAELEAQLAARGGTGLGGIDDKEVQGSPCLGIHTHAHHYKSTTPIKKMTTDRPFVPKQHPVHYNTIRVNELDIFYRGGALRRSGELLVVSGLQLLPNHGILGTCLLSLLLSLPSP